MLNPDVGQDVIASMKQEIHRMQLRWVDLRKQQETLIQELEKGIRKRDVIHTKVCYYLIIYSPST